jgi:hypothetical protein
MPFLSSLNFSIFSVLFSRLRSAYLSGLFFDVRVVVSNETFSAHRIVLVMFSEFFKRNLEGEKNEIEIAGVEAGKLGNNLHTGRPKSP